MSHAPIPLYMAESVPKVERRLRRWQIGGPRCPRHEASRFLDVKQLPVGEYVELEALKPGPRTVELDWPETCARCGYTFHAKDPYQIWADRLYRLSSPAEASRARPDLARLLDGDPARLFPESDLPVGACIDDLLFARDWDLGRGLRILVPERPDGSGRTWWEPELEVEGGRKPWRVEGAPPALTASPSIWVAKPDGWHGWLRGGQLVSV